MGVFGFWLFQSSFLFAPCSLAGCPGLPFNTKLLFVLESSVVTKKQSFVVLNCCCRAVKNVKSVRPPPSCRLRYTQIVNVVTLGALTTDTGVRLLLVILVQSHHRGNVIHFSTPWKLPRERTGEGGGKAKVSVLSCRPRYVRGDDA